jgi:hypothetical protein
VHGFKLQYCTMLFILLPIWTMYSYILWNGTVFTWPEG